MNPAAANERWRSANRILAVRLDAMGDLLMTGPALHALRMSHPSRRVTALTSPSGAAAARLLPGVDDVIVYSAPWMKSTEAPSRIADLDVIENLHRGRFDAAVIFTVYSQSPLPAAMMCHLAGIPLRLASCRENPYHLLTDWVRETEPGEHIRHEVRRQLDLVRQIGAEAADERMRVHISASARRWAEDFIASRRLGSTWLIVHPGASAPSRRYPVEGYAEAAAEIVRTMGCRILVTGSERERPLVEHITRAVPEAEGLIGDRDLGRFAALLAATGLIVTNNTGPAHLAAAVGTPVVSLYALTNPQHQPWSVPRRVLSFDVPCRNCYKSVCPHEHNDCLRRITPRQIVDAAGELLGGDRRAIAEEKLSCTR